MIKLKGVNLLLFITSQILIVSCNNTSKSAKLISKATIMVDTNVKKANSLSSNSNVINQKNIAPYKQVDSLMLLVKQQYNTSQIEKLDSICTISDGDLSEYFNEISIKIFNDNLGGLIQYLLMNPHSCLKSKLIEGIGANFSPYNKSERIIKLSEERERIILKAKNEGLKEQEIKLIQDIFKKVNPNLLD